MSKNRNATHAIIGGKWRFGFCKEIFLVDYCFCAIVELSGLDYIANNEHVFEIRFILNTTHSLSKSRSIYEKLGENN